jgi:ATP-dependent DNA ligase
MRIQQWKRGFAMRILPCPQLVSDDGEIVALDEQGRPSFQMLQHRGSLGKNGRVVYYAFDLLNLDGRDVHGLPLVERKELLAKIVAGSRVLFSSNLDGSSRPNQGHAMTPKQPNVDSADLAFNRDGGNLEG